MKKLLVVLLAVILVMAYTVGCVPDEETPTDDKTPATETPSGNPPPAETPAEETPNEGALTDGTFNAEGEEDERGWKGQIDITVADGKISTVEYDEVNAEGKLKSEDEEYAKNMSAASGVTPAEAYKQLEDSLLEVQEVDKVEVVTGATTSSDMFKKLANEALSTTTP